MDPKIKPIPAFYCCYLLRSTVRHASLYIGSSPNPARRLAQHNGQVKGGAVRTSRTNLRPWEMTCIVAGFPSNIAALQFEWAWQNAHLTRHILPEQRISFPVTLTKTNARTGKTRKKPGRPRSSLVDRLSNLHLLLRTNYFAKWPLELRFFSEDVYRKWQTWCGRVDTQLSPAFKITLDLKSNADSESSLGQPVKRKKADMIGKGGVDGIDPTYARYQGLFEKMRFLMDEDDPHHCEICQGQVELSNELYSTCLADECSSMSHITCLSEKFLRDDPSASVIPTKGCCPRCETVLEWSDLMRSVSLRMRGEKEVAKLLKTKRRTLAATAADIMDDEESAGDEDLDDLDDDVSVTSTSSTNSFITDTRSPVRKARAASLDIVIEDSEDER